MSFDYGRSLDACLRKCEIEWRAKNIPGGSCVEWLAPMCDNVETIADYLRSLGFKIRNIVDEEPWPGEVHRWVETTSGIIVYANGNGLRGFMAKSKNSI